MEGTILDQALTRSRKLVARLGFSQLTPLQIERGLKLIKLKHPLQKTPLGVTLPCCKPFARCCHRPMRSPSNRVIHVRTSKTSKALSESRIGIQHNSTDHSKDIDEEPGMPQQLRNFE